MTTKRIEEQIIAIQLATSKANESEQSAATFLRNAGIISANFVIKPTHTLVAVSRGNQPTSLQAIGIAVETPECSVASISGAE